MNMKRGWSQSILSAMSRGSFVVYISVTPFVLIRSVYEAF